MATSVLMASEKAMRSENEKNFGGFGESRPQNAKHSGRRKSKSNEAAQKKKRPQRGMGVAQLELLRLQERWKKMIVSNPLHPLNLQNHYFLPASFPDPMPTSIPAPFAKFGSYGAMNGLAQLCPNQALLLQRLGNSGFSGQLGGSGAGGASSDQFQADPYGPGTPNPSLRAGKMAENSKELSSMPNMRCYSDQSSLCHKKKRINGENFASNGMIRDKQAELSPFNGCSFPGFNLGNKQNIAGPENQDLGTRATIHVGSNVDQEVGVVAVHRKGSSGGGGSSVFMEYELFPGKGGRGTSSKELDLGSSEASVAVGGGEGSCVSTASSTGFYASNSIDLSLKLSY